MTLRLARECSLLVLAIALATTAVAQTETATTAPTTTAPATQAAPTPSTRPAAPETDQPPPRCVRDSKRQARMGPDWSSSCIRIRRR